MCLEHTFARLQQVLLFFFWLPLKHSPTHSSPLGDENRSNGATLTSPLGLQADVSPPWDEAGGGPPQQPTKPRVPRPIYDTFKQRLHCRHFRRQVAESWTCCMASCFHLRVYLCLFVLPTDLSALWVWLLCCSSHTHIIFRTNHYLNSLPLFLLLTSSLTRIVQWICSHLNWFVSVTNLLHE